MRSPVITRLFLLAFLVAMHITANAQVCVWARTACGYESLSEYSQPSSVITDAAGSIYETGVYMGLHMYFGSVFMTNAAASTTQNIYLVKYDSSGNVRWAKSFGGLGVDVVADIALDSSGNIFMTGSIGSPSAVFGPSTITNANQYTIFLAKIDSNGNALWAKSAVGAGVAQPDGTCGIDIDPSNNVIITGEYSGFLDFGGVSLYDSEIVGSNAFIAKYDNSGNILWAKGSHGASAIDESSGIATDRTGNIYMTGIYFSGIITFDNDTLTNPFPHNASVVFLAKYDPSGNIVWARSFGDSSVTSGSEIASSNIATDLSDNIYITGGFSAPQLTGAGTTLTNPGFETNDIFLVKYNSSGGQVWLRGAGGTNDDFASAVTVDASGNIFIGGEFLSSAITFGSSTLSNPGLFLARFDPEGNATWSKDAIVGASSSLVGSIAPDAFGHLYATGALDSPLTLDAISLTDTVAPDQIVFLAKYGYLVNEVPELNKNTEGIEVYPNPVVGELHITCKNLMASVRIVDVLGQSVYTKDCNSLETTIDVSGLPAGLYFVKSSGSSKKFLKQ